MERGGNIGHYLTPDLLQNGFSRSISQQKQLQTQRPKKDKQNGPSPFPHVLEGSLKKNGYFTVRQTISVTPSPPLRSTFCEFFWCTFDLILWLYFWNGFYTRKDIFIQLQEFPTPPYCRCCSVTKRSDRGIAEALKALKMHFWDTSQWDKMWFEYLRVIFHCKKWVKIFTFAYGQGWGGL